MADRTVSVKLQAEVGGYTSALRVASRATKDFGKDVASATGDRRASYDMMGKGLLAVGTAAAAGLGMAVKAAIEWETAWTGVAKTVDGNATQMAALEDELRGLTKVLPATHEEIAGVAEAAGQLGIERESVASFTKVMIDLGETTNLTADQAATAIAQISNVMGTSQDDVDRFGAALVELGNNGASTEAEILMMAQRIAGAGNQVGLTETDVLGFASALASVGIEAEAGGSAISTSMIKMAVAVNDGEDALDGFARVAGVSSADFKRQFEDDAGGAIAMFVEGLGRMQNSGEDVFGTLDELGLSEIRTRDAMLRLAGAGDLLGKSLDTGADAWRENTALTEEARKRYETTAAQITKAWNLIRNAAIEVGSALAPVLGGLATAAGAVAEAFAWLPDWAKDAVGLLGSVAAVAALLGGAFLLLIPRIAATKTATDTLGWSFSSAGKKALLLLGPLGVLTAAGQFLGEVFGSSMEMGALDEIDKRLTDLVKAGKVKEAKEEFEALSGLFEYTAGGVEKLKDLMPQYAAAVEGAGDKTKGAAKELEKIGAKATEVLPAVEQIANTFGIAGDSAEDTAKAVEDMFSDWSEAFASFAPMVGAYEEALASKEESERESAEKTAESTKTSKDSWEDFIGDVELTVDEYIAQLERMAKDQEGWSANMIGLAGEIPPAMLDELARLGPEGAGMVALLNDMTGAELEKTVKLWERTGKAGGASFAARLAEAGPVLEAIGRSLGDKTAEKIRDGMRKRGTDVYTEAKRQGVLVDRGVDIGRRRVVKIDADARVALAKAGYAKDEINRLLGQIKDEPANVKLGLSGLGDINATFEKLKGLGGKRAGGPISGPGTGTSDDVLMWGSNGEHMWTKREVDAVGGHGAMMSLRRQALGGELLPGFRDGGPVMNLRGLASINSDAYISAVDRVQGLIASKVGTAIANAFGALELGGPGLAWARSQDGKPYVWGGVGPGGYDCSGFLSAVTNVILGRSPHSRLFATGSFPTSMFAPGSGRFTIGSFRGNPGHMAGTLDGVNVESRGGDGVVVGPSARGANAGMFTTRAHLKGYAEGGEIVGDPPFDLIDPRGMHTKGSFRYGTKHVPWDGMYQLHRGETVTPGNTTGNAAEQAKAMQAIAAGVSIDYRRLGREVAAAMRGVSVRMDGRAVGEMQGDMANVMARGG